MKNEKIISYWAKALFLTQKNKPEKEREKILEKLTKILKKSKKGYLLKKIKERVERVFERENRAELILARNFDSSYTAKIKKKLAEYLEKDMETKIKVDKDLIAGFRAKTGNVLIRASFKDFLADLKTKITSS